MEPLTVSHQPVKTDDCIHCGTADILTLVCDMISQEHVITGLRDLMAKSTLRQSTILSSLVVISSVVEDIKYF